MSQEAFDKAFDAAKEATAELERLCDKYEVSWPDYNRVYEKIMRICEEVS